MRRTLPGEFSKFDEHAVKQMSRGIELIRYRCYADNLPLFELVNATTSDAEERNDPERDRVHKKT
ncbi:MAG: hypothetical protein A2X25_00735 [Chloroflexi bacterium GWB2_49_20]|nr:MAG: hypothetical protein A2X25_00735 [Chloroflexi bacterium GWB2_49_20]OGN80202.1 MAG: hypothetical protein A2X26_09595 [Chloroflexi bacterium GWC2_49_37]OGN83174.1 MAG: hypothetical protein A2X27_13355 [Chloroflexi bacterium GWD2_49_16]